MIAAIVPAKPLGRAKGRLAELLSEAERRALALAMLDDVVAALLAAPSVEVVAVVSPDSDVLAEAEELGATAVSEPETVRGINAAIEYAVSTLDPAAEAVLVVLADVPEIEAPDIERLIAELPERGAAASPSADGGTSALIVRPPGVMPFRFGEQSFTAHRVEALRANVLFTELRLASLSRDIDSPADLLALAARGGNTATHRLLRRLHIAERVEA